MKKEKINNFRISRGYRLRKSTHMLIKNLQEITGHDTDKVLFDSCRQYYAKILLRKAGENHFEKEKN